MTRRYTSRTRDDGVAHTRARIVDAAADLLPGSLDVGVEAIAASAGVSVQTIYTHFGSKRGLLLAVLETAQRDAGLYRDLDLVWSSPDGETALRRMADATMRLWHRAWPIVSFSERSRRTDPEIARYMAEVDGYRRANLRSISDRLEIEGRLRSGIGADHAADIAFAFSTPSVYDELVRVRTWPVDAAADAVVASIVAAVIEPGSSSSATAPADWSDVLRPPAVLGADGDDDQPAPRRTS